MNDSIDGTILALRGRVLQGKRTVCKGDLLVTPMKKV